MYFDMVCDYDRTYIEGNDECPDCGAPHTLLINKRGIEGLDCSNPNCQYHGRPLWLETCDRCGNQLKYRRNRLLFFYKPVLPF